MLNYRSLELDYESLSELSDDCRSDRSKKNYSRSKSRPQRKRVRGRSNYDGCGIGQRRLKRAVSYSQV